MFFTCLWLTSWSPHSLTITPRVFMSLLGLICQLHIHCRTSVCLSSYTCPGNLCSVPLPIAVTAQAMKSQYGSSWMRAAVDARKTAERTKASPRDELKRYLDSPLELNVEDVVAWWGVSRPKSSFSHNSNKFVATCHSVPSPVEHGEGLSGNPRLCYTIGAGILKQLID
jgi:hypothetical protein